MKKSTAAILIIGNEILSGRTQDLNVQYIAEKLGNIGIPLLEVRIIPDVESIIINTVLELAKQHTYVFTTGGIGATHDDITAKSIAKAFQKELVLNHKANELLLKHYKEAYNKTRQRMAYVPQESDLIENPVSAAPGFKVQNVYCLAGIPMVMRAMFDNITQTLIPGDPIISKTICTKIPENNIADELEEIQKEFPSVDIGSYPKFTPPKSYELNLVVRGTDEAIIDIVIHKLTTLIQHYGERTHSI